MSPRPSRARGVNVPDGSLLLAALSRPPYRGPMLVAAAGLLVSLGVESHVALPAFCSGPAIEGWVQSYRLLAALNSPDRLFLSWLAMVVAMMTPLIAMPLCHVRRSSLASRRRRAAGAFLCGYFGAWLLAGPPLVAAAVLLRLASGSSPGAFGAAFCLALLWSASPAQRSAQNRAHRLRRLGLFGFAADRDCLTFGAVNGFWCVCACWPWMLVTMTVVQGHAAIMILVTALVLAERIRGGGAPGWRWPVAMSMAADWARSRAVRISFGRSGLV